MCACVAPKFVEWLTASNGSWRCNAFFEFATFDARLRVLRFCSNVRACMFAARRLARASGQLDPGSGPRAR